MNMTKEQALFLKGEIESSMPGYIARANKHENSDTYMSLYPQKNREYWLVGVYTSDFVLADIVLCFASLNEWSLFKNAALCFARHLEEEVKEDQINEQAEKLERDTEEFVSPEKHVHYINTSEKPEFRNYEDEQASQDFFQRVQSGEEEWKPTKMHRSLSDYMGWNF